MYIINEYVWVSLGFDCVGIHHMMIVCVCVCLTDLILCLSTKESGLLWSTSLEACSFNELLRTPCIASKVGGPPCTNNNVQRPSLSPNPTPTMNKNGKL